MNAILLKLRTLRPWQLMVLLATMTLAFGAAYAIYSMSGGAPTESLISESQQLIRVERGDLTNKISTNGRTFYPVRESLNFGTSGTVSRVLVEEGQNVSHGDVMAVLNTATLRALEEEVANARITVRGAQENLDDAYYELSDAGRSKALDRVSRATRVLDDARGSLRIAETDLLQKVAEAGEDLSVSLSSYQSTLRAWFGINEFDNTLSPGALLNSWGVHLEFLYGANARDTAKTTPSFTRIASDNPSTPWNETTVNTWLRFFPGEIIATCDPNTTTESAVCVEQELDESWNQHVTARDQSDSLSVTLSKTVTKADQDVAKAEDSLEDIQESADGPDDLDLAVLQAKLKVTQMSLEEAIEARDQATIRAPFDGVIVTVGVENGQTIGANTPVVEIADPATVEIDGTVDEIDILFVSQGALAEVTMDALPDQVLKGIVSFIAPVGVTQQGVVSYPIRIQVQASDIHLPEGLSAVANIVIREDKDVLLIPLQALYGSFEDPTVQVVTDTNRIETRSVILGNSDDFWVVISEGISADDVLAMEAQQANAGELGVSGLIRRFQGGGQGGNSTFGVGGVNRR
jgi:HlyD family secretion protein